MTKPAKVTKSPALRVPSFEKAVPWILIIAGIIGLICSFALSYDQLKIASNPSYVPSCNLNPIVSCGHELQSKQGRVFGLPNPFFGIAAFAILTTIGVTLIAGARFKRWFWIGLQAGVSFGVIALGWFFIQSVYVINTLCPFCMAVWVITLTAFWYVTLFNIEKGYIQISKRKAQAISNFAKRHHLDILVFTLLVLIALILQHFWYYYGKHL